MSLALHGHHILIIATLAFAAAILTPNWYNSPKNGLKMNIFQICAKNTGGETCQWVFSSNSKHAVFDHRKTEFNFH